MEANGVGDIKDWIADLLIKNLEVTPSRESSLIDVAFTAVDPQFAALVANAFAEEFIRTEPSASRTTR